MTLLAALASGVFAYFAVGALTGHMPQLASRRREAKPQISNAQLWLVQAGVNLTPRQFWVTSIAVGLAAFVAVSVLTNTPIVAIVPAVSAALGPRFSFARQRARRLREVQEAWPDGLREILAGISAGMSLPQAVSTLAATGPEPLQRVFGRFPLLVRMLGVVPALAVVKQELADPTSDRVIEVLILAHEQGGRIISEILRDLAEATNEDVKTSEEIATNALEQKINARAVFVLPWIVLLFLTATPGHFRDFYQSGGGVVVVAIAGVLSLVGMLMLGRLTKDHVEQRVLGGADAPAVAPVPAAPTEVVR